MIEDEGARLVLNASPSMERGNTALILNPFIEGMKEEGAEAELLYVRELKVNPCQGEQRCWTKTPARAARCLPETATGRHSRVCHARVALILVI